MGRLIVISISLFVLLGSAQAETVLRIATTGLPPSLGLPYRISGQPPLFTYSAMYDGLTRIDEKGNVEPWLGLDWELVDPLTWRVTLRPGVRFSNGTPFTARAVKVVGDFLMSDAAVREQVGQQFTWLDEVEIVDDLTVLLRTKTPNPSVPRLLPMMYVVEPDLYTELGVEGFAQAPVSTGPFIAVDMDPTRATLRAFEGSWRPASYDRLEVFSMLDTPSRVQGLLSDRIDIAMQLGPEDVEALEVAGHTGLGWTNANVWAIHFVQGQNPALEDRRVREAINLAVNREILTAVLMGGVPAPANQPAPSIAFGYDPSLPPIPYDPDRAKELLAEAGYPDGFRMVVRGVVGSGAADGAMYQQVAQDLAKVGVIMEVRTFPVQQLIRNVIEGGWDADGFGLNFAAEPTVDALRTMRTASCLWPNPWYCDERIMPTVEAAQAEFDEAKGLALRHQIMQFYRQEYPAIFLYETVRFAGLRRGITGFAEVHGYVSYEDITLP